MITFMLIKLALTLFLALFLPLKGEVEALYLTWLKDPATTITIFWISKENEKTSYLLLSEEGKESVTLKEGALVELPENQKEYILHRVDLTDLEPDTRYQFQVSGDHKKRTFSTLPNEMKRSLSFVIGGDMYQVSLKKLHETNQSAALTNPDFAILGGDIAYSTAKHSFTIPDDFSRWLAFLTAWDSDMVTPDGRTIPLLPVIGNDETKGRYGQPKEHAPFFYALFGIEEGYSSLEFGDYLSLIRLDSGHTHSVTGEQRAWLEEALISNQHFPHKIVVYHIPAYPGARAFDYPWSVQVRKAWVPLFEKYQISVAFEHHDHCYKRTKFLKEDQEDETGILYLGDGGWGVDNIRHPKTPEERWYLAASHYGRQFMKATLFPDGSRIYEAMSPNGERFDHFIDDRGL